jgi:hypothetical protein
MAERALPRCRQNKRFLLVALDSEVRRRVPGRQTKCRRCVVRIAAGKKRRSAGVARNRGEVRDQSRARGRIAVGNKGDRCMGRRYETNAPSAVVIAVNAANRFRVVFFPTWPASTVGAIAWSERPETSR